MTDNMLYGAPVAAKIYDGLKPRIERLNTLGMCPTLRIGMAGDGEDDTVYRNMLIKKAADLGIRVITDIALDRNKSVVARAVMATLAYYDVEIEGKNACVIGRSEHVGFPIAKALLDANATVTICHSKTDYITIHEYVDKSDIVVAAAGVANVLDDYTWYKLVMHDAPSGGPRIIVDVGCNILADGIMVGDVDPDIITNYSDSLRYTPVPGGIGPVTIAVEMLEAVEHCEREAGINDQ